MNNVEVSILRVSDWETYKKIRLLSLQDSPDSYSSSYESEVKLTNEKWISRINYKASGKDAIPLVAKINGVAIGLAWGMHYNLEDKVAYIYQMWVSPSARGMKVGKLLLSKVISWANKKNLQAISLDVISNNLAAFNLYKSAGFQVDNDLKPSKQYSHPYTQTLTLNLGDIAT